MLDNRAPQVVVSCALNTTSVSSACTLLQQTCMSHAGHPARVLHNTPGIPIQLCKQVAIYACKVVGGVEEMELHSCLHPLYHFIPLSIVVMSSCIFYFSFVFSIV